MNINYSKVLCSNKSSLVHLYQPKDPIYACQKHIFNLPHFRHCDTEWEDLTQNCWAVLQLRIWGFHLEKCLRCPGYWGCDTAWSEWKYAAPTEAPTCQLTARSAREILHEMIPPLCRHLLGEEKKKRKSSFFGTCKKHLSFLKNHCPFGYKKTKQNNNIEAF